MITMGALIVFCVFSLGLGMCIGMAIASKGKD